MAIHYLVKLPQACLSPWADIKGEKQSEETGTEKKIVHAIVTAAGQRVTKEMRSRKK